MWLQVANYPELRLMTTETVDLKTSYGPTTAYLASPDESGAEAAVVLIHEWWGINDHVRDIAGRYAREGYLCLAPDLFRGKTATDSTEAAALMSSLGSYDGISTIRASVTELTGRGVKKIGITGFCMGGTFALSGACEIDSLAAAAPFYGDIPAAGVLADLKVPTLFIAGLRDAWINPAKVEGLKNAAKKHGLPVEVVSYDADHAFFNDTRPEVYDATAAADAWRRVLELFRERLLS
jgi:carboxymethylenebutenolidase